MREKKDRIIRFENVKKTILKHLVLKKEFINSEKKIKIFTLLNKIWSGS